MWALDEDLDVHIEKDLYIQNNRIKNDLYYRKVGINNNDFRLLLKREFFLNILFEWLWGSRRNQVQLDIEQNVLQLKKHGRRVDVLLPEFEGVSTIDKVLNSVIFKITIVVVRGPEGLTFAYSIIKMKENNNQMRKRNTLKSSSGVYQIWSDKDPYSK